MSTQADVDRGLEIIALQEALKKELAEIESRLEKAGLKGTQIELEDAEREGRQFLATGTTRIVPVVFTADLIMGSFADNSAKHLKAKAAAGEHLREFYLPSTTWEGRFDSGKIFRKKAAEIFGEEAGPAFVSACLARDKFGVPKSQTKIEWKRAAAKEVAA